MTVQQNKKTVKSGFEIRQLQATDVKAVAKMAGEYFPEKKQADFKLLQQNLLSNISQNSESPSLVCASQNNIHGFIFVNTVDFNFKGTTIKTAVCSDFMVSKEARKALIPMRMLQTFLNGPQDLSFTDDAIEASRLLWCKLGGEIAYPYSTYYQVPLRPLSFLHEITSKHLPSWTAPVVSSVASGSDRILEAFRTPFSHIPELDEYSMRTLTPHDFERGLSQLSSNYDLFPSLSSKMLKNHISVSKSQTHYGSLETASVRDLKNKIVGWFLYYRNDSNRCNVIHAQSLPGQEEMLFNALKRHAFSKGGIDLSGRISPSQLSTPFAKKSLARPGKRWVLVHSKYPEIIHTIQSGNAFLSRCW